MVLRVGRVASEMLSISGIALWDEMEVMLYRRSLGLPFADLVKNPLDDLTAET